MNLLKIISFAALGLVGIDASAHSMTAFSNQDQAFVAKVSQGGMYEVKLGELAKEMGMSAQVKENGAMEARDHTGVGRTLAAILKENGWEMPNLNATFQARLDKMKAVSAGKFDAAYLADMKEIHDADGAAFAKEAKEGANPDLKDFAADTYKIVQRHLKELSAVKG